MTLGMTPPNHRRAAMAALGGPAQGLLSENEIHHIDARDGLDLLRPDSVAVSFWSPPYFVGKSYELGMTFPQWEALLADTIGLHEPILKPGGFMVVNIADILCFQDDKMPRIQASKPGARRSAITREDVLAMKRKYPDARRQELATLLGCSEQTVQRRLENNNARGGKYLTQTRVQLVGGLVQEWAARAGLYLYDRRVWVKDPCWQNSRWHSNSYRAVDEFEHLFVFWKPGITEVNRARLTDREWGEWGSRAVWRIPSVRANDNHDAKFPLELARRVVRLFSDAGDLVVDPFVGSGTTAIAAQMERRRFVGMDAVKDTADLAKQQLASAAQMAA